MNALDNHSSVVAAAANRLRMLQVELADEPAERRGELLMEELRRLVGGLPKEVRGTVLNDLLMRFPTWEQTVVVEASPAAPKEEPLPRDPVAAAALLTSLVSRNPNDPHRRQVLAMLEEAGLVIAGAPEWPPEKLKELKKALALPEAAPLDPSRVLDVLAAFVEFTDSLERLMWKTCRELAPDVASRHKVAIQKDIAKFLEGSADAPKSQLAANFQGLNSLVAAFRTAPSQVGDRLAIQMQMLSPDEIQTAVGSVPVWRNKAADCWEKYKEISRELRQDQLERTVREIIRDYVTSVA